MQQDGLQHNAITYSTLISASGRSSFPERALHLFEERRQDGFRPNGITYSALISACGEGSVPERALQFSDKMRQDDPHPNVITYIALIRACGKSSFPERALQFFEERPQADSGSTESPTALWSMHAERVVCQRGPSFVLNGAKQRPKISN